MKNVLILGSTGFIGRNISEYLSRFNNLKIYGTFNKKRPFLNKNINFIKCNLLKKKEVEKALKNKDIIIMASATSSGAKDIISKPYVHVTDNSIMNSLILRSAFELKVKHVIFLSCTVMYRNQKRKTKEKDFNLSKGVYEKYFGQAWMKVFSEKMCEFYSKISQTKYTIIRHSNIYGPHDKIDINNSHVFGATINKVILTNNNQPVIWGDGKETRDLLYVDDLNNFIKKAIYKQKNQFEIFNVGLGKSISITDLTKKIARIGEKKIYIKYDLSKQKLNNNITLDCTKAKKILNWKPKYKLDLGIKKTLDWYKKNYININSINN
jgi:nucleoside-diphosphate-sugar epimerase